MEIIKTDFQIAVINRVKVLRSQYNVGQTKLAQLLDVCTGQIGNIESPKFQHKYTLKQLYTIAKHFGVTLDYLLTGEETILSTDSIIKLLIKYDE